jgi:5'-nucleotidase
MTHILLTNDDGIESPGLRALLRALTPLAQVTVLAPDHNWSAAGHTKTLHKPLRVGRYSWECPEDRLPEQGTPEPDAPAINVEAYTTTGAPSDCVVLALLGILPDKPGLIVSGINQGSNLGHDVTYSGTVAAAMEAAVFGLPAVAVSLDDYDGHDFDYAAQIAARVVGQVVEHGLPGGTFLNVNVPALSACDVAGIAITRLGRRVYREVLVERQDPRGRPYYWIGGDPPTGHLDQGTDIWAVFHGYVSVTPIHLDMTAHDVIADLQAWQFEA